MTQINDRKTIRSWAFFDWANSAYNLVITSTIFPAYYTIITSSNKPNTIDYVQFMGFKFVNTALYNYALAFAFLIIAILSPVLSGIADSRGNKKFFMKIFTWIGALSCCGLYFFEAETLQLGIVLFILAAIGFWGSLVFYNAYLPEIATPDMQDTVSAKGYAYGYVGSILLQLVCFVFVFFPDTFGLSGAGQASRLSFLLVGIWWIAFAQIPFRNLPDTPKQRVVPTGNILTSGFKELSKVWVQLKHMPYLKRFLTAFFFYSMGVQTVMLVATVFGEKQLQLPTAKLIGTIMLLQVVAIPGAMLMSWLSKNHLGNIRVLIGVVIIWIGVCIAAYFVQTELQFYFLAAAVGLIMGGIQSLSRSTYSKYLPQDSKDHTSFFSFFDVTEKIALVIGMFSFGYIEELTGSMRNSLIALALFFVAGLAFLWLLRNSEPRKIQPVS
ncbi:MFS transporter permease [Pedobacter antarcticus 4BY]|uniref:MFS transporter permease n=2 Tax=Pedobacter antarcticus TaxID=34086 RepID=A0A081PD12_9SPHI|nr:MFS transporter [Pedobacter antarcticus]KEQ28585.1 MFS transporter permease [Pedobacter antarcticus 4BY]SFE36328.1 MFS transporter, UMF1 family [Pedobacter antarcticus]